MLPSVAALGLALASTEWQLALNVGQMAGMSASSLGTPPLAMFSPGGGRAARPSWFEPTWASSGARLLMPLGPLTFAALSAPGADPLLERMRPRALVAPPTISYITMGGEQHGRMRAVGWGTLEMSSIESLLVWCVDLDDEVAKGDITLPRGRLFFSTRCWNADETAKLRASLPKLKDELQADLDTPQTLDGGPLALKARIDGRRALEAKIERLQRGLPAATTPTAEIALPGGGAPLTVALEGQLTVRRMESWFPNPFQNTVRRVAARLPNPFEPVAEYGVVGSFKMAPARGGE